VPASRSATFPTSHKRIGGHDEQAAVWVDVAVIAARKGILVGANDVRR
jgi:hypothetical protein